MALVRAPPPSLAEGLDAPAVAEDLAVVGGEDVKSAGREAVVFQGSFEGGHRFVGVAGPRRVRAAGDLG